MVITPDFGPGNGGSIPLVRTIITIEYDDGFSPVSMMAEIQSHGGGEHFCDPLYDDAPRILLLPHDIIL